MDNASNRAVLVASGSSDHLALLIPMIAAAAPPMNQYRLVTDKKSLSLTQRINYIGHCLRC